MARVAAIDCGTNSIRLLVADVTVHDDGTRTLRDVHREMRIVRLGQGVDATGRLNEEALRRTGEALVDYERVIESANAVATRMVATSATRDAANREDFFSMVRDTLGVEAEIITGEEEAHLSFVGAVGDLDPAGGPFAVTDVGGGSTELVLGTWDGARAHVESAFSVDVGSVRITERCLHSDPPTADEVTEGRKVARGALDDAFASVDVSRVRTWIGVAGTVTTISAVAQELPTYDPAAIHLSHLTREQLASTASSLLGMSHEQRAALGPMHPGRVDVIGGGALVMSVLADELAERAGVRDLTVSEHDILDGIALSIS